MGEWAVVSREEQRKFIKRERIRRALIKTGPNESICLQGSEAETLLKWIKELEERAGVRGFKKV